MEQIDSQSMINGDFKESFPKKKERKKKIVIIYLIMSVILIAIASVLYVKLYKIPHDMAVENFNNSVNLYHTAVTALEERNKALDASIEALSTVVYAENIPIDEFLLLEADSVLTDARNVEKDSAPILTEMPQKTDDINAEASKILEMIPQVEALGDYSDVIELLSETEIKYQTMIEQFTGCKTEVIWTGVDEENNVLRFVVKLSNPNLYPMRDITTEWIAYDKNGAIVGSFDVKQADIPANGYIYYVGGAGSANLSGIPARVELQTTVEGVLTNRALPNITVGNVQIKNHGFNWFTASADCTTDSEINSVDLDGQIIIKDADGQIIAADFWSADNLPDSIDANGKFTLSEDFFNLSTVPTNAEIYVYYVWQ